MFKNQKELPVCEYGVSNFGNDFKECGLPATYIWNWGSENMFVCDEHNKIIEKSEGDQND